MKARIKFKKNGALRFIGHLDVMRFFQKAMRRAGIPIAFTKGYSPHMIMSFASPLGIGHSSDGEYFDIELKEAISGKEAVKRLNDVMVEGMEVVSFRQIGEEKKMTGMAIVAAADYLTTLKKGSLPAGWKAKISEFLAQPEIRIWKQTKRSENEVDIKPLIYKLEANKKESCKQDSPPAAGCDSNNSSAAAVRSPGGFSSDREHSSLSDENSFYMQVAAGSVQNLKPELVMEAFCRFLEVEWGTVDFHHHRLEMYADVGTGSGRELKPLEDMGWEMEIETA
ncbi:TIGR03936 family radical SAM-associated protein [Faecalicatena contorta]|uniref:Radical SAM-linked protein n=1 Tax=Faecalicatena contorta TaxID=39482 RepID=A0A316A482_9FIRM|nr:TIGR03936 family radical SAM-associated protein [Faecalicatena contorta]PWJ52322.1 radical SAM-linked protein [Faecalicatena contorta]SUQ12600.1 radical SAM-linked protein [Faecalicatena contorta]